MEKGKNKKKLMLQVAAAAMLTFATPPGAAFAADRSVGSPQSEPAFSSMKNIDFSKLEKMLEKDLKEIGVEKSKGWDLDFFPEALPAAQAEELQQRICDGTIDDKAPDGQSYLHKLATTEGIAQRSAKKGNLLRGVAPNGWVMASLKAGTGCQANFMTKNTASYRAFSAVHESMHIILSYDVDQYAKAVAYSVKNDPDHPERQVTKSLPDDRYEIYVDESVADLATMIYFKSRVQDQASLKKFAEKLSAARSARAWDYVHNTSNVLDYAAPLLGNNVKPEAKSLKQAVNEAVNIIYKVPDMQGHYAQSKALDQGMTAGKAWPSSLYQAQVRLMQP